MIKIVFDLKFFWMTIKMSIAVTLFWMFVGFMLKLTFTIIMYAMTSGASNREAAHGIRQPLIR